MTAAAVVLPPVCELEHDCTARQAHAILTAYTWSGIALAAAIVIWAVVGFIDWRKRDRW